MKLKVTTKGKKVSAETREEQKPKSGAKKKKLPQDTYHPMFEPVRLLVKEYPNTNDGTTTKQFYEFRVQRANDEIGLPHVFITGYLESSKYTGYQKGRTVSFPLEALYEVIDTLNNLSDECDRRKIEY